MKREGEECDQLCLEGKVQELAGKELEKAIENIVLEEKIEIEGLEIIVDLEELTEHGEKMHEETKNKDIE